jgi:excinuclease UvrABC nuclease subunit
LKKYYVYRFLNRNRNIIYIGRTKDIDKRIKTHFSNGHLPNKCYEETEFIEISEFSCKADTYIYEVYLISKYKPKYNTEFKDIKCSIQLSDIEFKPYPRLIKVIRSIDKSVLLTNKDINLYNELGEIQTGKLEGKSIKSLNTKDRVRITKRDVNIIEYIYKNPGTTTNEIFDIFFGGISIRTCQIRIQKLVDIGVIYWERENILDQRKYFVSDTYKTI